MGLHDGLQIRDTITAELVECPVPEPDAPTTIPAHPPDLSPATVAAEATIEQTGAGPPPDTEP